MPWRKNDYPVSMKNLEPRVRNKAIEIANALLEEGYEEGRAIAIATAKAKEWNDDHPLHHRHGDEHRLKREGSASNLHVVPCKDGWAVKEEGAVRARLTAETKAEAVEQARAWASDSNKSAIIHRKDGTVETAYNYT
ncbi:DUF2188 domain-containing protein [Paenibacillus sp. H1-7]|uniref:DUF2188 domain-containing protein n=1 Tax=Paenibacillus sp. H1-7 TaxID=2282849 RepID=UPI001EF9516C|nr:DUF2188 domain-containing protein [Paenibacillus sp. H1-7]ULL18328.1 DUF2188 domain-containing protein [Paenibacillus sp. H1-7]